MVFTLTVLNGRDMKIRFQNQIGQTPTVTLAPPSEIALHSPNSASHVSAGLISRLRCRLSSPLVQSPLSCDTELKRAMILS
ncbi:hypothetical protein QYF36_021973 [Acer negundo]|nr:hypothetical protein QYF36_021973 [Acer negundo]